MPAACLPCSEAAELARLLLAKGWVPDIVLASNARRSRQTLEEMGGVMEALADADSHLYGSLYTINALDGQTRQHIEEVGQSQGCWRGGGRDHECLVCCIGISATLTCPGNQGSPHPECPSLPLPATILAQRFPTQHVQRCPLPTASSY